MMNVALINSDLEIALVEILLAVGVMGTLLAALFGATKAQNRLRISEVGISLALILMIALVVFRAQSEGSFGASAFSGHFLQDRFATYAKLLVLVGALVSLLLAPGYLRRENIVRYEYPVLIGLATLGMLCMISASSLVLVYMGLELQSLSLYVLAAIRRDSLRSSEAGLKYFMLGAVSSGLFLFGASLVYGHTGSIDFETLRNFLLRQEQSGVLSAGFLVGMVFVISGLIFKISAAPFHMWTPEVYEGSPTPVTAFFAIAPKIAAFAMITRLLIDPFGPALEEWRQVIVVVSILSMLIGSFGAIAQTSIKRLMAYSSIGHMGYGLIALVAGGPDGVTALLLYWLVYLVMNSGVFGLILSMRSGGEMHESIASLAGFGRRYPVQGIVLLVLMFSLAGIPPMAGFFAKFYVFFAAVDEGYVWLAVVGAVTSVVSAFYYLRIIKIAWFDEESIAFDRDGTGFNRVVSSTSAILVLLFPVVATPIVAWTEIAARSLAP